LYGNPARTTPSTPRRVASSPMSASLLTWRTAAKLFTPIGSAARSGPRQHHARRLTFGGNIDIGDSDFDVNAQGEVVYVLMDTNNIPQVSPPCGINHF